MTHAQFRMVIVQVWKNTPLPLWHVSLEASSLYDGRLEGLKMFVLFFDTIKPLLELLTAIRKQKMRPYKPIQRILAGPE